MTGEATSSSDYFTLQCVDNGLGGFNYSLMYECSDSTCTSCETAQQGVSPSCLEETHDGATEYVQIECISEVKGFIRIFEGEGVQGCSNSSFLLETEAFAANACVEDDHGFDDHGDDDEDHLVVTCHDSGNFTLGIVCNSSCGDCEHVIAGANRECIADQHHGELEYWQVSCPSNHTVGHISFFVDAGCERSHGTFTAQNFDSGVCRVDAHGFHAHIGEHDDETANIAEPMCMSLALLTSTIALWMIAN